MKNRTSFQFSPGAAGPVLAAAEPENWRDAALCAEIGGDLWFPLVHDENKAPLMTDRAKRVCRRCPVRINCLDYALDAGEEHGIWGGFTERERRKFRNAGTSPEDAIKAAADRRMQSAQRAAAPEDRRLAAERERRRAAREALEANRSGTAEVAA